MTCPDENKLAELSLGLLGDDERAAIEHHLAECVECRAVLEEVAGADAKTAPPRLEIGDALSRPALLGRFVIVGHAGTGGTSTVFIAYDPAADRLVALKVPRRDLDAAGVSMLEDEARLSAQARHPNIVRFLEAGSDGPDRYLAFEHLDGVSAAELLRGMRGPLDPELAAYVVAEAAAGLHAAHELCDARGAPYGLVHRDVSPHNIFLTFAGGVRVLDFGIAKARDRLTRTDTGVIKGKLSYMAPEQARAQPVDRRADVFALGAVLFELSTGSRPFAGGADLLAMARAIMDDPLPDPAAGRRDYPAPLRTVVMRAMRREPAERYATAAEIAAALGPLITAQAPRLLAALVGGRFSAVRSANADRLARARAIRSE